MGRQQNKTNVMRILDNKNINYNSYFYDDTKVNAVEVANILGQNPSMLFKTLITIGKSKEHYAFMIPGDKELDLKKAALAAGEKSLEMIPQKELLPLTGYIHGGCSPIGMKKTLKTFIDSSAENFETIYFSGGRVGCQVQMPLSELQKIIVIAISDVTD